MLKWWVFWIIRRNNDVYSWGIEKSAYIKMYFVRLGF
jgi:hypothetical protein